MELEYFGGNCLKITTKKASLVIDDNLLQLGATSITKDQDVALFTGEETVENKARLVISEPGEYEVSNASISGIAARAFTDEPNKQTVTIYKILADDINVVVTGHIHPSLSDQQLEAIGPVDVLCVPVGDENTTLDGAGAAEIVKKLEPKIVIPTYYQDAKLKYPAKVADLSQGLKGLSMEAAQTLPKLKVKPEELGETTRLIVLERQ